MRQPLRPKHGFFSSHFTSNLMLPACLQAMILVEKKFATEKNLEISLWLPDLKKFAKKQCLREISAAWHLVQQKMFCWRI